MLFTFLYQNRWVIFACIMLAIAFFSLYTFIIRMQRKRRLGPHPVDEMEGIEFEHFLAKHFESQGFTVTVTQPGHDFGADLIIERDGVKTAVQAKRYEANISISAVQEVFAAAAYYECDNSMVITNSYYTASAKTLAEKIGVELWDRDALFEIFQIDETS